MSWAMQRIGKPSSILKKLEVERAETPAHLKDVELDIRNRVLDTAICALKDFAGPYAVQVKSSGHMSKWSQEGKEFSQQTVNLDIQPMGLLDE
jgi:hypothetical protein